MLCSPLPPPPARTNLEHMSPRSVRATGHTPSCLPCSPSTGLIPSQPPLPHAAPAAYPPAPPQPTPSLHNQPNLTSTPKPVSSTGRAATVVVATSLAASVGASVGATVAATTATAMVGATAASAASGLAAASPVATYGAATGGWVRPCIQQVHVGQTPSSQPRTEHTRWSTCGCRRLFIPVPTTLS